MKTITQKVMACLPYALDFDSLEPNKPISTKENIKLIIGKDTDNFLLLTMIICFWEKLMSCRTDLESFLPTIIPTLATLKMETLMGKGYYTILGDKKDPMAFSKTIEWSQEMCFL